MAAIVFHNNVLKDHFETINIRLICHCAAAQCSTAIRWRLATEQTRSRSKTDSMQEVVAVTIKHLMGRNLRQALRSFSAQQWQRAKEQAILWDLGKGSWRSLAWDAGSSATVLIVRK